MPFSVTDRSSRQKISTEIVALKGTINQPDLTTFIENSIHQQQTTHSSQATRTIHQDRYILGPKIDLKKRMEVIQNVLPDYNGIKLKSITER